MPFLRETSVACGFATLPLVAVCLALRADAAFLRPETVANIGSFCHTGTVTMVCMNRDFTLEEHDGRRHFFVVQRKQFGIRLGDFLVVEGNFTQNDNGKVLKTVRRVHRLGQRPLAPPEKVPLSKLTQRRFLYRRVTTEGTIVLVRHDEIDASAIQLLVKDGSSILNAAFMDGTAQTADVFTFLGARVRLTGMLVEPHGARRNIANYFSLDPPGGLEVVQPPPADLFNAPELDFGSPWTPDDLARMDAHRFDGIVMATWGGNNLMLAGRGYHRVKAMLSRSEELPPVGRHVAVVGFPATDLYGINLIYARCRPMNDTEASGPVPEPPIADSSLRQLLSDEHGRPRINGYSHGRLLRLKGTVLDVQPSLTLFSLNDDGLTMPIDFSSSSNVLSLIETNSKVEAVVLAVTETDSWRESIVLPQTRGLKLILRSAADLKVLAHPPWWTPAKLTTAIMFLLVLSVFIVATNRIINRIMMRRKIAERTRLAVELHDSLSQALAGVACQIAAGENAVADDPEAAKALLKTAERMLESSRTELKNCLFDLRNDTVDDQDFARAIAKTLTLFRAEADIAIRFHAARHQMTDSTAHAILCIIRELVANAIRHGAATCIRVAGTAGNGRLHFSVRDNGGGFDPEKRPGPREGHFGLASIQERLAEMKGSLTITSAPGKTRAAITLTLP